MYNSLQHTSVQPEDITTRHFQFGSVGTQQIQRKKFKPKM